MSSINKVLILGNLTADPEIKETPSGKKVASFSVATSIKWKDDSWNKQEKPEFHRVTAWAHLAELAEKYLSKWKKVHIEWRLETRSWETDDGQKRYSTHIIAESMILLTPKSGSREPDPSDDDMPESLKSKYDEPSKKESRVTDEISIDDIPF